MQSCPQTRSSSELSFWGPVLDYHIALKVASICLFFCKAGISTLRSRLVKRNANRAQSLDRHSLTSFIWSQQHHKQCFRIARSLSCAFWLPVPIRYLCKWHSVSLQCLTSTVLHPEQFRHRSRIACLRFRTSSLQPSLRNIFTLMQSVQSFTIYINCGQHLQYAPTKLTLG